MDTMLKKSLFLGCLFASSVCHADPIQDMGLSGHEAGWFPNFIQGQGPMTCRKTCDIWTGLPAETEKANDLVPGRDIASVCKITKDPTIIHQGINDPSSHWLYGNQQDKDPVCTVGWQEASGNLTVTQRKEFMCLCVSP